MHRVRRIGFGAALALVALAVPGASPAAAQTSPSLESCGDRPSILQWDVNRERSGRRTVSLDFRGRTTGAPIKPVAVVIQRPGLTRMLSWRRINRNSYSYRTRARGATTLTAVYAENRSRYRGEGSQPPSLIPTNPGGLPNPLELLPAPPVLGETPIVGDLLPPGLPEVGDLLPDLGPLLGGGDNANPEFVTDVCLRSLVRSVG